MGVQRTQGVRLCKAIQLEHKVVYTWKGGSRGRRPGGVLHVEKGGAGGERKKFSRGKVRKLCATVLIEGKNKVV